MAEYSALKAAINAYIKRNGRQQITGTLLNSILNAVVSSLGAGYQFMGVADGDTEPGTPDARVFYLAPAGDYDNFGGTEVPAGSLGVFCYDSAWSYDVIEIGGGGSGDAVLYVEQALTTEQKAQARSNIGAGTGNGTYSKPGTGIPKTDLASGVQTSLEKADSAYQKPNDGIPSTDLAEGVQTSLGKADSAYQKPQGGIPSTDLASPIRSSLGKAESAVQPSDLNDVAYTGKYSDLSGKPTIPDAPGTLNTDNTQGQQVSASEALSGNVKLHKVSKTGSYEDLLDKPSIPAAQVNADWNANSGVAQILNKPTIPAAQVNADWDAESGVAQILNKPTIPAAQVQSDWGQSDNTKVDFIKSKPAFSTDIATDSASTDKIATPKAVADFAVQALTSGGKKIWVGTQADYDLLTPDANTLYFITTT